MTSLAHDFQPRHSYARSYLPKKYRFVVFLFYGILAALAGWVAILGVENAGYSRNIAVRESAVAALTARVSALDKKIGELRTVEQASLRLDAWSQLNSPMQIFVVDVLGTLEEGVIVSELLVERSKAQSQYVMELSVLGGQDVAGNQFRKTINQLAAKGYQQISIDQRPFSGGMKLVCTLGYHPRLSADSKDSKGPTGK